MSEVEKAARKAFQVVYHRCSECDRAWVDTEDGPAGIPAGKVGWREGFAEVVKLEEDGGVRGACDGGPDDRLTMGTESAKEGDVPAADEKGTGNGVSHWANMKSGNNGDQAKLDDRSALENAPRGPWMSSGNNDNRATIDDRPAGENAPRGPGMSPGHNGDRATLGNWSTVEKAPRGAQAGVPHGTDATREKNGAEVEDTTFYSLDEVPDEITLEWWAKYKLNF